MTTENIAITQGVTYFMDVNAEKFPELMNSDYIIVSHIRETETNLPVASFDVVKVPSSLRLHLTLPSASSRYIDTSKIKSYSFDVISINNDVVNKLVDGNVTFKKLITGISISGNILISESSTDLINIS